MKKKKKFRIELCMLWLSMVCMCMGFFTGMGALFFDFQYECKCEKYIKQASCAATPEIAIENLDYAISYLNNNEMTSGTTSYIFNNDDARFWFDNLVGYRYDFGVLIAKDLDTQFSEMRALQLNLKELKKPIGMGYYKHPLCRPWFIFLLLAWALLVVSKATRKRRTK